MNLKKPLISRILFLLVYLSASVWLTAQAEEVQKNDAAGANHLPSPNSTQTPSLPENNADACGDRGKKTFLKAIIEDQGYIYAAPFRIKKRFIPAWTGVLAVTGLLIAYDQPIYREIKRFQARNHWVDDVSPVITRLGEGGLNLGVSGLFALGGWLLDDPKALETARLTFMTFIHTGLVVQLGKHLTGRQRPSWDAGNDHWSGPAGFFKRYKSGEIAHYDAFPSGHTITVFGTATVIAEMYKKSVWVPILCYSAATLTGLSRVTEDTHWLSDVFLGAVLGYAIGKLVISRRHSPGKLRITPVANTNGAGLSAVWAF